MSVPARHMQVVAGEEEPVGDPVAASEGAVHAREEGTRGTGAPHRGPC